LVEVLPDLIAVANEFGLHDEESEVFVLDEVFQLFKARFYQV